MNAVSLDPNTIPLDYNFILTQMNPPQRFRIMMQCNGFAAAGDEGKSAFSKSPDADQATALLAALTAFRSGNQPPMMQQPQQQMPMQQPMQQMPQQIPGMPPQMGMAMQPPAGMPQQMGMPMMQPQQPMQPQPTHMQQPMQQPMPGMPGMPMGGGQPQQQRGPQPLPGLPQAIPGIQGNPTAPPTMPGIPGQPAPGQTPPAQGTSMKEILETQLRLAAGIEELSKTLMGVLSALSSKSDDGSQKMTFALLLTLTEFITKWDRSQLSQYLASFMQSGLVDSFTAEVNKQQGKG